MEKGAIVNNGEGYYLRGAGEHGSDLPIYEIQEGSYCYNANGELCLIGEDKQAKKIIWGKQTTVTGGLNRPVEIEIAKDESGNDILINGQPIMKPGSQEKYLDQVGDGIEEEKPLDDKKWIIGGELVAPGSSGAKGEGVSGNTGKGSNVVNEANKAELNVPGTKYYNSNYKSNMSMEDMIWGAKYSDKGLSTMGSATKAEAMEAGKSWVGPNYKTITNSSGEEIGYSSQDGMRAFRITYKSKEGITRANFQENTIQDAERFGKYQGESKVEIKNVHVDIVE